MFRNLLIVAGVVVASSGCGPVATPGTPDSIAGGYTIAATNSSTNTCNLDGWTNGESATDIGFTITQNGTTIHGRMDGVAGDLEDVKYGSRQYDGTISGNDFDMSTSTRPMAQGNCAYTLAIDISGSISGDSLTGTRTFRGMTNSGSDCGALTNCQSIQQFNGTRPPAAQ